MDSSNVPPIVRSKDEEHLRLLAVFHYVVAGIGAMFACIPLLHVAMGVMMLMAPEVFDSGKQDVPQFPAFFGIFIIVFAGMFVLTGWAAAVCTFISGRYLAKRKKRMFSFVMAALLCGFMPFGTVLGIFTIIVLSKESVQRLYETAARAQSAAT